MGQAPLTSLLVLWSKNLEIRNIYSGEYSDGIFSFLTYNNDRPRQARCTFNNDCMGYTFNTDLNHCGSNRNVFDPSFLKLILPGLSHLVKDVSVTSKVIQVGVKGVPHSEPITSIPHTVVVKGTLSLPGACTSLRC